MTVRNVHIWSKDVKRIYKTAFTPNERMPFWMMTAMSKLWNTRFQEFSDDGTLCGFIYYALNHRLVFIMFFAVDESLRSHGYGSEILKTIQAKYPKKKILVSIEPCDDGAEDLDTRIRRKAFYQRNGFNDTGWKMKLGGTEQNILISNGTFNKREFVSFFAHYSNGTVWPKMWKQHEKGVSN